MRAESRGVLQQTGLYDASATPAKDPELVHESEILRGRARIFPGDRGKVPTLSTSSRVAITASRREDIAVKAALDAA